MPFSKKKAWICAIVLLTLIPTVIHAAHKPVFTWQVRGDVNYCQWICDGDDPIAMFDMSSMDEPMQALMMFQKVPRPILLRYLKLTPGGKPLVSGVQLYWKSGVVITDVLDGLEVKGSGTDRLTVVFTVKDKWDTITVVRTLTVTYDASLNSYVYDFKDNAVINFPESLDKNNTVSIEYCDPWMVDSPAPSQKFDGMWKGRYTQFAYESSDGRIVSIPHVHYGSNQKGGIRLKQDGILAAVYEPDGNPAIQIMGETASKTVIGICGWAYDIHLGYRADAKELYKPIKTHFRIILCPDDKARSMNSAAVIPNSDLNGLKEIPMYERSSSFEKALRVGQPHSGDIDPWGWVSQDEAGTVWDAGTGRTGSRSLKIEKDTPGIATWHTVSEGQGYFTEPWTPCKGYEISCWVRTEKVDGEGASVGVCYIVPNVAPKWPFTRSRRLTGTNGWTKLTVSIGQPPEDTSIMSLHLQQVGKGTTWFDDLEVKMLR
ncbi:hypothetical protein ACFL60_03985 [Candidatus Omnitrophota bacterium]